MGAGLTPFDRVVHLAQQGTRSARGAPGLGHLESGLQGVLATRRFVSVPSPNADFLSPQARFVTVDHGRTVVPVTATDGADPLVLATSHGACGRPSSETRGASSDRPPGDHAGTGGCGLRTSGSRSRAKNVAGLNGGSLIGLEWAEIVRRQIASGEALARGADR